MKKKERFTNKIIPKEDYLKNKTKIYVKVWIKKNISKYS